MRVRLILLLIVSLSSLGCGDDAATPDASSQDVGTDSARPDVGVTDVGVDGVSIDRCMPHTCDDEECGTRGDGCGSSMDCGPCPRPAQCDEWGVICGTFDGEDDSTIDCGACEMPAGVTLAEAQSAVDRFPGASDALGASDGQLQAALEAYVMAEAQCRAGLFQECNDTVRALWERFEQFPWPRREVPGASLGVPPFYSALRTFEDYSAMMLDEPEREAIPRYGVMVLVSGRSRAVAEDPAAIDLLPEATLDPRLAEDGYRAIRETFANFDLFMRYVTQGRFSVRLTILYTDEEVNVDTSDAFRWTLPDLSFVGRNVPREIVRQAQAFLLVYPNMLVDYANSDYTVGGVGGPTIWASDQWYLQKISHLGDGAYSTFERQVYFHRWLQHEFMHSLYGLYPEFGLEETSHQWFDRATWPDDFIGDNEVDYYHESIRRVIHPRASRAPHERLFDLSRAE